MAEVYVGKQDIAILPPSSTLGLGGAPITKQEAKGGGLKSGKCHKPPHLSGKLAALQGDKPQHTKRQLWRSASRAAPPVSQRRRGPAAPPHVSKEAVCQVGGLMGLHLAPVASVAPHPCKSPSLRRQAVDG